MITREFGELQAKARYFALFYDYTLYASGDGGFDFYNSPIRRSFRFKVDPSTYTGDAVDTLLNNFKRRLTDESGY